MTRQNHSSFINNGYFRNPTSEIRNILRGGVFLFFLLIRTLVSAQETPSRAFAILDSNVVTIGDKVKFIVGVELDASSRVLNATPDMPVDTSKFDAIELGQWDDSKMRSRTYARTIIFQAFDTGLYRIPSVVFTLETANGVVTTVQSPTMLLTVNNPSGIDAVLSPIDIKPIVATKWTFEEDMLPFLKEYLPYLILILALGFLAWRYWQYRKNRDNPPVVAQIIQPPHIIAERLLAELRAKQLWQNGKTKEYYSELSHILRGYLEDQFKIPALESTTDELMTLLKKRGFDADVLEKTQNLLQTADLVKFAKVEPPVTLHDDFLINAEAVVAMTKPKPVEIEEPSKVA